MKLPYFPTHKKLFSLKKSPKIALHLYTRRKAKLVHRHKLLANYVLYLTTCTVLWDRTYGKCHFWKQNSVLPFTPRSIKCPYFQTDFVSFKIFIRQTVYTGCTRTNCKIVPVTNSNRYVQYAASGKGVAEIQMWIMAVKNEQKKHCSFSISITQTYVSTIYLF